MANFIEAIAGVLVFTFLFLFGVYWQDKKLCYTKYNDFQPEFVAGTCTVQYNGKTVRAESLRVME